MRTTDSRRFTHGMAGMVLMGAVLAGLCGAAPAVVVKQPKLVVPEPVFDFSDVDMNASVTHEFVVRNEGSADLLIQGVTAGCSCTAVSSEPKIAPGKSGVIRAVLDTSRMMGGVAKQITVSTNDPETPRTILTLKAMIKPHTVTKPDLIRLKGVQHEPAAKASIVLWALDGDDFTVTGAAASASSVRLSFKELLGVDRDPDGRGRQWRIEAELDPLAQAGPINALAYIQTNQAHAAQVVVALTGFMSPSLVLIPVDANLGDVLATPAYLRELHLENLGSADVKVLSAESDVPGVSAEIRVLPDGKHMVVGVRLASSMPKGPFSGQLTIKTSSAFDPTFVVPLSGNVL
ncbi:MAG: DUF1573 domain-containing protein [Acidobacteriota bacterium]